MKTKQISWQGSGLVERLLNVEPPFSSDEEISRVGLSEDEWATLLFIYSVNKASPRRLIGEGYGDSRVLRSLKAKGFIRDV